MSRIRRPERGALEALHAATAGGGQPHERVRQTATAVEALGRSLPRRNLMLLKAESLTNDGTALVVYAIAVGWPEAAASGWAIGRAVSAVAGFRGAVSLAIASSVPNGLGSGPFGGRDAIVFVTTGVIVLTLLVQGPLLPIVVRWARLPQAGAWRTN